jgi:3'(2'), 5'-bisphosphate nucleotidase
MKDSKTHLEKAIRAAIDAGQEILSVYHSDFSIEQKADKSPITLADKKAHKVIVTALSETGIPVLSEEGKALSYDKRKQWNRLWIVDPLDGTKEFISKNDEFTVNIALVENQTPVLGVIYVPVTRKIYFAAKGFGSFVYSITNTTEAVDDIIAAAVKLPLATELKVRTIIASRSHRSVETAQYVDEQKQKYGEVNLVSAGSSLKFCLVAEGAASVYPRFAPTMEWDTAAGQIIASEAGKKTIDYTTQAEMVYNKPNLLNNWFLVE